MNRLLALPAALRWGGALASLQVADVASTYWALSNGAVETNPVVLTIGLPAALGVKLALCVLITAAAHRTGGAMKGLQFACILYAAICLLNVRVAVA